MNSREAWEPTGKSVTEVKRFGKTDLIPPEYFPRIQLDRSIGDINMLFLVSMGAEKTPIQTATDIAMKNGEVELLDVGCGTGNTLRTWAMSVAKSKACPSEYIGMTGISLHDYREESSYPQTRQSHKDGRIRYLIGDASDMSAIEDNSKDVTLAHASLIHSLDPVAWMKEMVRVTKRGGVIYFDLSASQSYSDTPIMNLVFAMEDDGYLADIMPIGIKAVNGKSQNRTFCRIEKPVSYYS